MLSGPGNTRPQYQHYSGHSHHPPAWMSMMNTLNVLSGSFKQRHLTLVWARARAVTTANGGAGPLSLAHWHWSPILWWTLSEDHKRSIHLKLKISTRKWENGPRKTRLAMHYWFMIWCDGPLSEVMKMRLDWQAQCHWSWLLSYHGPHQTWCWCVDI